MSNEKTVVKSPVAMTAKGVTLSTMDDAWRFSLAIVESGAAPKGLNTPAKIFAVVQAGAEFGLPPMAALSNMKNINGRVGPMGKVAKGLVLASGKVDGGIHDKMRGKYGDPDYCCRVWSTRTGNKEAQEHEFSVADAKRAGLWGKGGPWTEYPKQMLYYRALGFHLDKVYPDVMMGFVIAEALDDYPVEKTVTGVVLEPLDHPENDPILDLLPAGKIAEDLESQIQEEETAQEDDAQLMSDVKKAAILEKLEAEDEKTDNAAAEGEQVQAELL